MSKRWIVLNDIRVNVCAQLDGRQEFGAELHIVDCLTNLYDAQTAEFNRVCDEDCDDMLDL